MLKYFDIVKYSNIDFNDYLKFQGSSFSYLKGEINGVNRDVKKTDNMQVGTLVDVLLTENGAINMRDPLYPNALQIANSIRKKFNKLIEGFECQISYTAQINYEGFVMPVKGRLDYLLPNIAVIDLKVTQSKDIKSLIEFMRYKNQLWHYCNMGEVKKGYLMIHSVPLKDTFIVDLEIEKSIHYNDFWAEKVLKFGSFKG